MGLYRRSSLAFLLIVAATESLSVLGDAQALPTATGPGQSIVIGVGTSAYHIDYGHRWLAGPHAWIDYTPLLHFGIEGEARLLDHNEDLGTHASTLIVGPRIVVCRGPLEPYVKVLVGSGHFNFPYRYAQGNYLIVAGGGGVDLHVGPRLQVRVLDVEYQRWPQFTFGAMTSFGVSTGISYTIRRGETWLEK